jgi:outer membrane protein assembly factor BamB
MRLAKHFSGVLIILLASAAVADDWPQWRGPHENSTYDGKLPTEWSDDSGIAWKAAIPAWGTSTPVVSGDAIFITTQDEQNRLLLIKLERRSGKQQWRRELGAEETPRTAPKRERQNFHRLHNLASPSPVTDGRTVVVHFGNGLLAAYDFAGQQRWRRNLQDQYGTYTTWWGHANSPVIVDGLVISVCMQDSLKDLGKPPAPSYLVAHDLETGEERWKSMRMTGAPSEEADAYTTPILMQIDGQQQLVVMGANELDGYDPRTGRQLWFLAGLQGGRTVTGPTAADGRLYVTRGMRGALLCITPGGNTPGSGGELSREAILWQQEKTTPDTPCPVVAGGLVFTVTDDGIARTYDAATGKLAWTQRLGGDFKASPIAADGRIYFLNTSGLCTVVAAKQKYEKLAENQLNDETLASPAAADGRLLVRGRETLYCIGAK